MPWQDNSGKGNGSGGRGPLKGPWGQQPPRQPGGQDGGRGRNEPPDLDELLNASRQRLRRAFPRNGSGGGGRPPQFNGQTVFLVLGAVFLFWIVSGFFQVGAKSRAVITTFGKYERVVGPGLHWRMPFPFQNAKIEIVTEIREMRIPSVDHVSGANSPGLMLTGDKNIVDIAVNVFWQIRPDLTASDGGLPPVAQFIYRIQNPENLIRAVAEASLREVVGSNELDFIQTNGRAVVMEETRKLMQQTLDAQSTGILITEVNLDKADPPTDDVNKSFLDVIAAAQDKQQYINLAQEYANKILPEARGQAQQIIEDSKGYQARVTADARGQASRFDAILNEYKKAPEVTRQRMYLETMERVLGPMDKIVIDEKAGKGVVPYLPLNELAKSKKELQQ
ncbi:MAG: FtsH protease activity modulator HflK [Parvularculaceae bacterium]